jgi:hypothetical protein
MVSANVCLTGFCSYRQWASSHRCNFRWRRSTRLTFTPSPRGLCAASACASLSFSSVSASYVIQFLLLIGSRVLVPDYLVARFGQKYLAWSLAEAASAIAGVGYVEATGKWCVVCLLVSCRALYQGANAKSAFVNDQQGWHHQQRYSLRRAPHELPRGDQQLEQGCCPMEQYLYVTRIC